MKTKTKTHTPGPWKANPAKLNPKDPMFYKAPVICGGIRIANVAGIGEENSNANARLIAAAPELLDACIMAKAQLGDLIREDKATDDDKEAYETLSKAIEAAGQV